MPENWKITKAGPAYGAPGDLFRFEGIKSESQVEELVTIQGANWPGWITIYRLEAENKMESLGLWVFPKSGDTLNIEVPRAR